MVSLAGGEKKIPEGSGGAGVLPSVADSGGVRGALVGCRLSRIPERSGASRKLSSVKSSQSIACVSSTRTAVRGTRTDVAVTARPREPVDEQYTNSCPSRCNRDSATTLVRHTADTVVHVLRTSARVWRTDVRVMRMYVRVWAHVFEISFAAGGAAFQLDLWSGFGGEDWYRSRTRRVTELGSKSEHFSGNFGYP